MPTSCAPRTSNVKGDGMLKGNIFEIKKFAVHDGDGIRTTVFFKGCTLKCLWCHNPEGIKPYPQIAYYENKCVNCGECISVCKSGAHLAVNGAHEFSRGKCTLCGECIAPCMGDALCIYGREYTADEIMPILTEDREFYENSGGGVTLSGGECLMQADFCRELLIRLKDEGIHTAVDTCGFVGKSAIDRVLPFTDIFLYDIKAYDEAVHKKCTGVSNKEILSNLLYIDSLGKKTEVRIPFVPGLNDGETESIGRFLCRLKNITGVRVLPYHNYAGSKYGALGMENTLPEKRESDKIILSAKRLLSDMGLKIR